MTGIGLLGTGGMAARMARTIAGHASARLVAVGSGTAARARRFADAHAVPSHGDRAAVLADPSVDLVYVASRTRDHADLCVQALEAGKAVLCEKPFALDTAGAQRVAEAAARSGRFFMEAMWIAFLPAHRRLADLVLGGHLGRPRLLQFDFGYPVAPADLARLTGPEDGGILFDRGCYGAFLARQLFGPVAEVSALAHPAVGAPEDLVLTLRHRDGALSQVAVSAGTLLSNAVRVSCSGGNAGLDPPSLAAEAIWSQTVDPRPLAGAGGGGLRDRLKQSPTLRRLRGQRASPRRTWASYGADPYAPMLDAVIGCLARGETSCATLPLSLSLETVAILEQAARSIRGPAP